MQERGDVLEGWTSCNLGLDELVKKWGDFQWGELLYMDSICMTLLKGGNKISLSVKKLPFLRSSPRCYHIYPYLTLENGQDAFSLPLVTFSFTSVAVTFTSGMT